MMGRLLIDASQPVFILTLIALTAYLVAEQRRGRQICRGGYLSRRVRKTLRFAFWSLTGLIVFLTMLTFYAHPYSPLEDEVDGPDRFGRVTMPANSMVLEEEYDIYVGYSRVVGALLWAWTFWVLILLTVRYLGVRLIVW